jgi:hypothetical protein
MEATILILISSKQKQGWWKKAGVSSQDGDEPM